MVSWVMVMVVVAASPFVATDGGYASVSKTSAPHRTLEVAAPRTLGAAIVVSDGDAPGSHAALQVEGAGEATLETEGTLFYENDSLRLSRPDALTLRIERSGPLTVRLPPIAGEDGDRLFLQRDTARFIVTASAPFILEAGGTRRVEGASTWLTVQLMPMSGFVHWPTSGGPAAYGASMVWDEARGRLTRFGGTDDVAYLTGTFVWDDTRGWVDLQIPSPPPRLRAGMAYDRIRQRIVLFGGQAGEPTRLDDTWEFDGTQWTQVLPTTSPSPRWAHGLVYDPVAQKTVLFGGLTGSSMGELNDTWTWDGTQWVELFPLTRPSPRDAFGMTWDNANQRVVLAGGWDGFTTLSETWSWDGAAWTRGLDYVGTPRTSTALAFNPLTQELVLAGGNEPRGSLRFFDDVDRLGAGGWRRDGPLPRPLDRVALASHPVYGVVLFGGRSPSVSDETWQMTPQWAPLSQGRTPEGRVAVGPDRVMGKTAMWFLERGQWKRERGTLAPPLRALTSIPDGYLVVSEASDGGAFAWLWTSRTLAPVPEPGAPAGGQFGWAWTVSGTNQLRRFDGTSWAAVANVPAGLRVLEWGPREEEVFGVRGQALVAWNPISGNERLVADGLPFDGGEQLLATEDELVFVKAEGTWHVSSDGGAELFALPAAPERLEFGAYLTDAGLGRYAPLKPRGARCESSDECDTNSCRSGRCCNEACAGSCDVCSVLEGAVEDGICSPAPATTECYRAGCLVARCVPSTATCGPITCEREAMDAGEPVLEPDAGRPPQRDAGSAPTEPEPDVAPPGCGCDAAPGVTLLLTVLALRRRTRKR